MDSSERLAELFWNILKMSDDDREAASNDVQNLGSAWIRIDSDGTATRIPPASAYIRPAKRVTEEVPADISAGA